MARFALASVAALLLSSLLATTSIGDAEACFAGAAPEQRQATVTGRTTALHALGKTMRRVRESVTNQERSREDLKIGIAGFYDRSSKLWENVWGERKILKLFWIHARYLDNLEAWNRKLTRSYILHLFWLLKTCTTATTSRKIARITNRRRSISLTKC